LPALRAAAEAANGIAPPPLQRRGPGGGAEAGTALAGGHHPQTPSSEEEGALQARTAEDARAELLSIEGVGPVVVEALGDFFHEAHNRAVWDDLLSEVEPPEYVVETL